MWCHVWYPVGPWRDGVAAAARQGNRTHPLPPQHWQVRGMGTERTCAGTDTCRAEGRAVKQIGAVLSMITVTLLIGFLLGALAARPTP